MFHIACVRSIKDCRSNELSPQYQIFSHKGVELNSQIVIREYLIKQEAKCLGQIDCLHELQYHLLGICMDCMNLVDLVLLFSHHSN